MHAPLLSALAAESLPRHAGADSRMGALLLDAGKLTPEAVDRVARTQQELGLRFGDAARRLGLVNQDDIDAALARQFAHPVAERIDSALSPRLVAAFAPDSAQGDALRAIRSQLLLRWFGPGRRALAVVGVGADSSVTAANLALVFAQLGQRTLLVDANLRHGAQRELFGLRGRQGLSDMLAGRAGLQAILPVGGFSDLSVLTAGTAPPNPQELLERPGFAVLNEELEGLFEVVLYDVAASAGVAQAMAVAGRAGAALLLAQRDHTPVAALGALARQLGDARVAVVGSVLVEH